MTNNIIIEGRFINSDEEFFGQIEIDRKTGIILKKQNYIGNPTFIFPKDKLIFAGFGDIHIHAREDETERQMYKEEYATVNQAALNGGVIHVSCMPNTPSPLTTQAQLDWHKERCRQFPTLIFHYVGVGKQTRPLDVNVPYKVFTGPSVGDLFFKNEAEVRSALQHYKGKSVSFHVEDYDVLQANNINRTHQERRPVACVETALAYVLQIIEDYDLEAKLCHWSTGGKSIEMIKAHRARGYNTTLEVSPLNLFFDADMLAETPERWPFVQMNPTIQGREHRVQLLEGLRSGFIQYLATDHAPHTIDEKLKQFEPEKESDMTREQFYTHLRITNLEECRRRACLDSTSGTPQLDTYGPFTTWLMQAQRFTPQDIARVAAENPGNFVNQFHNGPGKFGKIEKGYYGSLTVIDPTTPMTITREMLRTKAGWSPFEGITFPGSVYATIVKGQMYRRG
ncbi:amidohydrolase family protein [Candidatus Woesearchaeota archaeon]|nr:amidohydrolase family protein [Candidatus Woesearchaeota archaeon]